MEYRFADGRPEKLPALARELVDAKVNVIVAIGDEAIVAAGELHGLVKRGLELGLSEDELGAAVARVCRLCEELGMDARA